MNDASERQKQKAAGAMSSRVAAVFVALAFATGGVLVGAQSAFATAACLLDTSGADDINANQKDLNEFCQSAGNDGGLAGCLSTDANLTWTWDDTGWTGSNTGDACALYDTDGDGKANFALCASVQNSPAVQASGSPRFYSCDDTKALNCGGSMQVTAVSSCVATNVGDAFSGHHKSGNVCNGTNCSTRDTQAQCCVKHSDFPSGSTPALIDVCSYPSSSPSSSPSECVKAVLCTSDSDCSALTDACNTGTCASDGLTKRCVATPKTNGTTCNDGNACTTGDTCQSGSCTGGTSVTCTASDQCHVAGTCDSTTGQCSNPAAADGTGCDDGDACTAEDTCQSGTCTPGTATQCTALDQCHVAGICDSETGLCSNPARSNGTTCDDGDACTTGDTCQNGSCGGTGVTCTASDQCHVAGICDSETGLCSNPARANGASCSDGNACTLGDTCQAGICSSGAAVSCTALDQCHDAGVCDSGTGTCTNPAKTNGASCSDGNPCTHDDTCQAGTCTSGAGTTCTALDQCHDVGTCDAETGTCSNPAKTNGASCSDGNACTQNDTCQSGTCTAGAGKTCTALDQCHEVGTCDSETGACSNPAKANDTTCNDGNACTVNDTCQSGTCGGTGKTCTALDQCHDVGTCDGETGECSNPAKTEGATCDDGNKCTTGDTCQSGTCGGTTVTCQAQDQCHNVGTCNATTGVCSNPNKANGATCSDDNACTTGDTCQAGSCQGGTAKTCTALDQCHVAGTCDSTSGICSNPNATDGTPCVDGNACTLSDTCQSGTCVGGNGPSAEAGCRVDTSGADDAVGQKDLSEFCVNHSASCAGTIFTWQWDDTAWSGTNTGDACALYDTNGNTRADYALCVTVTGKPAVQASQSPRLYRCADTKQFNCAGATLLTATSTCTVNDLVTDPFAPGPTRKSNKCNGTNCLSKDTQAQCCVKTADLPSTAALIDVCSYPSQSPSSDPSECVKTVFCSSNTDCTVTSGEGTCHGTCSSVGGVNECVF